MITLNSQKFAETENEFLESLFTLKTCNGYATKYKRKIKIFNAQKELIGVLNCWGVLCHASKLSTGENWFSFATIQEVGEYGAREQREDLDRISISYELVGRNNPEIKYFFK